MVKDLVLRDCSEDPALRTDILPGYPGLEVERGALNHTRPVLSAVERTCPLFNLRTVVFPIDEKVDTRIEMDEAAAFHQAGPPCISTDRSARDFPPEADETRVVTRVKADFRISNLV